MLTCSLNRIVVGVTGSAAALSVASYIHAFRAHGVAQIDMILTSSATRFVQPQAVRSICDTVVTEDSETNHVSLARGADAILVVPASAHTLGCLAHGLAPNTLTTTILAADCPVILVPAMNLAMWRKPAVQRNVDALVDDGFTVIAPRIGQVYELASRSMVEGLQSVDPQVLYEAVLHIVGAALGPSGAGEEVHE